ncbi:MAG TPA: VanZ family protein, partial [Anaerolineaceae bacterium]|nr:VanZ family protein [Anaerolineaceae bacterium]
VLTPLRHKGWLSFTLGLTISLTIEILQLGFLIRVFDVDDLILNSIGAWLGFLVFLVLSQIKPLKAYFERIASAQRPHAWLFVLLYGAFVAATAAGIYWRDYNAYLQIPQ